MRGRSGIVLGCLILLAAGCLDGGPQGQSPHEGEPAGTSAGPVTGTGTALPAASTVPPTPGGRAADLGFGPAWTVLDECPAPEGGLEGGGSGSVCFEPTVTVDGAGRTIVAVAPWTVLAVGTPGGSFTTRPFPATTGLLEGAGAGDGHVQSDGEGRLVVSAFRSRDGVQAVQVAVSTDGAETWLSNVQVGLAGQDSTVPPLLDRQWVAAGGQGRFAAAYSQAATGIWVSRSADGGMSFGPSSRVAGVESRGTVGLYGEPVFRGSDLLLPHFSCQGDLGQPEPLCMLGGQGQARNVLSVAVSRDGGAFSDVDVARAAPGTEVGAYFPSMAVTPDGTLVLLWAPLEGPLSFAVSRDGGTTWRLGPVPAPRSQRTIAAPHVLAHADGNLSVVWAEWQDGSSALLAAGFRIAGDSLQLIGGPFEATAGITDESQKRVPNTDLMRHAILETGRVVTVWTRDGGSVEGAVATLW